MLIKQSDGGTDQNNTSPRVILASCLLIVQLKLVGVVLVRTCYGISFAGVNDFSRLQR